MVKPQAGSALSRLQARTAPIAVQEGGEIEIPLEKIRFDATQPRKDFHHPDGQVGDEEQKAVEGLAEGIKEQGLIHAITVEPVGDGTYRVLVGERRTRAHLLLGRKTIRARIRADLATNRKRRLMFQLAENVTREDLTDRDMAQSIRQLMEGTDGEPPMKQSQIAAGLGKSEGWISRFVKFGDDEMQRLWVQSGIADTVENVYRLSILPTPQQVEIQRRTGLPPEDPDHLPKPVPRAAIDEMTRLGKIAKNAGAVAARGAETPAAAPATSPAVTPQADATFGKQGPEADADPVTAALTAAAQDGQAKGSGQVVEHPPSTITTGSYKLDDSLRTSILAAAQSTADDTQRAAVTPPVNIRGNLAALQTLIKRAGMKGDKGLNGATFTLTLPMPVAQRLANSIAGVVVEPHEVAAVVQRGLAEG